MSDAYVVSDPTTGKRYAVCGSAKVEIDPLVFDAMIGAFGGETDRLKAENAKLREVVADGEMHAREILAENAELREGLAASIPLPLDGNCSAIHPDDIIGNNVGGTDFFGRVTEMYLTRYPRDGQPALWVVRVEDDGGNVTPYVCWGGRCNAVHKKASQTYSAEYLETYDENRRLKAENSKLRELAERAWKTAERLCQAFDGPCSSDGVTIAKPCPMGERDEECVYGQIQRELRELGAEVD